MTGVDSARKLDMIRSIGADHVINYTKEDSTQSGKRYDVILDVPDPFIFRHQTRAHHHGDVRAHTRSGRQPQDEVEAVSNRGYFCASIAQALMRQTVSFV